MKLVTYLRDGRETLGALHGDKVLALAAAAQELGNGVLPQTLLELIAASGSKEKPSTPSARSGLVL